MKTLLETRNLNCKWWRGVVNFLSGTLTLKKYLEIRKSQPKIFFHSKHTTSQKLDIWNRSCFNFFVRSGLYLQLVINISLIILGIENLFSIKDLIFSESQKVKSNQSHDFDF